MVAKILIVDDEPHLEIVIRQLFRKRVRNGELSFFFAGDGEEALALLDAEPEIEVVFSDINMPVMNGLTLLKKLEAHRPLIRTVIITAYSDMKNIRAAMNHGAFDFLTKPINLEDLDITLTRTLAHVRRLRAAAHAQRERILVEQLHAMASTSGWSRALSDVQRRFLERLVAELSLGEAWLCRCLADAPLDLVVRAGPGRLADDAREALLSQPWIDRDSLETTELELGDQVVTCLPVSGPNGASELVLTVRGAALTAAERDTARALVAQATPAFEHARLFAEVRRLATKDHLTGLDNRQQFLELARKEICRARRYGNPVVAILLDVDGLAAINSRTSNETGDAVLRAVAGVARGTCRETDLIARYGGDEIAILLIETRQAPASEIADRLRVRVAALELILPDGAPLVVTISVGVAAHLGDSEDLSALLARAGRMLSTAKERGMNRTEVA